MNKIIFSIILTLILVIGINKIADVIYSVEKPENSAYQIDNTTTLADNNAGQSAGDIQSGDIMALFASTNAQEGEKVFKSCAACHSIAKGGKNKIGPALYNVLGRKAGSLTDYKYSKSMIAYGKKWTPQEINGFLIKPKEWIKGTKMSYSGLKKPKDRAAIILYMNKNMDNPLSLN